MERGTVSMRVAFVLRSAEVQPFVPGFVRCLVFVQQLATVVRALDVVNILPPHTAPPQPLLT